jgi:hypothetical protein
MQFPVVETVSYYDDFGGPRHHPGNDLMGQKLFHELAANDGKNPAQWRFAPGIQQGSHVQRGQFHRVHG